MPESGRTLVDLCREVFLLIIQLKKNQEFGDAETLRRRLAETGPKRHLSLSRVFGSGACEALRPTALGRRDPDSGCRRRVESRHPPADSRLPASGALAPSPFSAEHPRVDPNRPPSSPATPRSDVAWPRQAGLCRRRGPCGRTQRNQRNPPVLRP